jgi:hypothetical protein
MPLPSDRLPEPARPTREHAIATIMRSVAELVCWPYPPDWSGMRVAAATEPDTATTVLSAACDAARELSITQLCEDTLAEARAVFATDLNPAISASLTRLVGQHRAASLDARAALERLRIAADGTPFEPAPSASSVLTLLLLAAAQLANPQPEPLPYTPHQLSVDPDAARHVRQLVCAALDTVLPDRQVFDPDVPDSQSGHDPGEAP